MLLMVLINENIMDIKKIIVHDYYFILHIVFFVET